MPVWAALQPTQVWEIADADTSDTDEGDTAAPSGGSSAATLPITATQSRSVECATAGGAPDPLGEAPGSDFQLDASIVSTNGVALSSGALPFAPDAAASIAAAASAVENRTRSAAPSSLPPALAVRLPASQI